MIVYSIGFEIEILHEVNTQSEDIKFHLLHNGKTYYGFALTLEGIKKNMKQNESTGKCINGAYFGGLGLIILKEISIEMLERSVADLIQDYKNLNEIFLPIALP
ncbi:MAG: hypothetical protein LBV67_03070 [Streptococcaceae bacterium]|jgi:hypothetical protein|nr:hypothetical protein [Streptococcaceae bacterium]